MAETHLCLWQGWNPRFTVRIVPNLARLWPQGHAYFNTEWCRNWSLANDREFGIYAYCKNSGPILNIWLSVFENGACDDVVVRGPWPLFEQDARGVFSAVWCHRHAGFPTWLHGWLGVLQTVIFFYVRCLLCDMNQNWSVKADFSPECST